MRKKIVAILYITVTVIYVIIGAILLTNIQLIDAPDITINIEVKEIGAKNAILNTKIMVDNPNSFKIIIKNLEVSTKTSDGYEIARAFIEGGGINPGEKRTFIKDITVDFENHAPDILISKITGEIGANIISLEKTIPLNIGIVTSIDRLINDIAAPIMNTEFEINDISNKGVDLNATVDVYNPNNIDLQIHDISNDILSKTGKKIGNIQLTGKIIPAKKTTKLEGKGSLLLEALNEKDLNIDLNGTVSITIAGYKKNLSFEINNTIKIPDVEDLVFSKDNPAILSIKIKGKFTLKGYLFEIIMEVDNTYNVDLEFKDITCEIFLVKNENNKFIGECKDIEDIIVESKKSDTSKCDILVPYSTLYPLDRGTDWVMSAVSSKIYIRGVNQSVFFEIRGYQDFNIIT